MENPSHLEALLAEDQWARRLARALVRGGEDPEDLVQEAYVRSAAHFGSSSRSAPAEPRAWLGRVLRNVLAELRRARGTREHRELVRAREAREQGHVASEPTADELAARAEVQERLAAAVLALEPRQRDVVLLRHFDGACVADIARRLGLARATVHEHLERGHAELRRVLSTSDDDRRMTRGLALLVVTGDLPRQATAAAASVVAVGTSPSLPLFLVVMNVTKSLAAVALVAALSFVAWRAVAPPDIAPPTLGETGAVTMEASDTTGSDREAPLEVADTGSTRAGLAKPETRRSESGAATLRVRVVDEDNVGVHLARVLVTYDGEPRDTSNARATPDTDRDGLWSETVPAGKELDVSVWHQEASGGHVTVAALADDATFESTVRVRTRPDMDLELSVIEAATHEPIGGARVFLASMSGMMSGRDVLVLAPEAASDLVTGKDGTARVRVKSWHNVSCRVHAKGYSSRVQTVRRRSAEASNAVERVVVMLERGARILGRATGAPVPAEVRVSFSGGAIEASELVRESMGGGPFNANRFELRVPVDGDGQFIIADVPGGAAVALALHDPSSGALLYEPAAPLVTVAGEDHHVTWDLGATRRVVCTVREADGTPAGEIQVLLFARDDARVGATPDGGSTWSQSAPTDEAGVALLEAIAPGAWLIGVAPSGKGDDAFAAYTLAVEVPEAPGDVHVDFVLHRGLYIEGRVIAPGGGTPTLFVNAHNERFHHSTHGKEIVDGRFRLGPLIPGLYKVSTMAFTTGDGPSYAPPPEVEVSAGTAGIELVLRPGGKLVLHAIDASSREAVRAEFVLSRVSVDGGLYKGSGAVPSKTYGGLEPGTYCALALAPDGRVGVLESISLSSTEPVEAVVPLALGGTLVLRAPLDGLPRNVYVMRGDGVVALHQLERSAEERSVLPPGRYRVGVKQRPRDQLRSADAPRFDAVLEVEVIVGEEVTLDVAPR
jgi:RNA polymerase sigma factor (sigma-70 family)